MNSVSWEVVQITVLISLTGLTAVCPPMQIQGLSRYFSRWVASNFVLCFFSPEKLDFSLQVLVTLHNAHCSLSSGLKLQEMGCTLCAISFHSASTPLQNLPSLVHTLLLQIILMLLFVLPRSKQINLEMCFSRVYCYWWKGKSKRRLFSQT